MQSDKDEKIEDGNTGKTQIRLPFVNKISQEIANGENSSVSVAALRSKPIADLFPSATVLFADIAGFTAWSSVREPTQVFTLLETVYSAFDG